MLGRQVHGEVKHLVNLTLVERYHVDTAARNAVDHMQTSVSSLAMCLKDPTQLLMPFGCRNRMHA